MDGNGSEDPSGKAKHVRNVSFEADGPALQQASDAVSTNHDRPVPTASSIPEVVPPASISVSVPAPIPAATQGHEDEIVNAEGLAAASAAAVEAAPSTTKKKRLSDSDVLPAKSLPGKKGIKASMRSSKVKAATRQASEPPKEARHRRFRSVAEQGTTFLAETTTASGDGGTGNEEPQLNKKILSRSLMPTAAAFKRKPQRHHMTESQSEPELKRSNSAPDVGSGDLGPDPIFNDDALTQSRFLPFGKEKFASTHHRNRTGSKATHSSLSHDDDPGMGGLPDLRRIISDGVPAIFKTEYHEDKDHADQTDIKEQRRIIPNIRIIQPPKVENLVGLLDMSGSDSVTMSKLEVLKPGELFAIRLATALVFLFFVIYTATVVGLANNQWTQAGCNDIVGCAFGNMFLSTEWFNFVFIAVVCSLNILAMLAYSRQLYLYKYKKHRLIRADAYWLLIFIWPTEILWNNPAFNLDRVSFTDHVAANNPTLVDALSFVRYITCSMATAGFAAYVSLKLGSISRPEKLDERYSPTFYLIRLVPMSVLFGLQFFLQVYYRVEFSPLPFVSLFTLLREKMPSNVYDGTIIIGVLNVVALLAFIVAYWYSSRKIQKVAYSRVRQKYLQIYFLYSHTFLNLGTVVVVTIICSSVISPELVGMYQQYGKYMEDEILDLPYYARAGVKLVFSMYALIESIACLPGRYKASWLERQILKNVPILNDMVPENDESASFNSVSSDVESQNSRVMSGPPLLWDTIMDVNTGIPIVDVRKMVMTENILAFNLSWLVYLDDDSINELALTELAPRGIRFGGVWRTPEPWDLTFLVAQNDTTVFVAFRGTVTAANWKVNTNIVQELHEPQLDDTWVETEWMRPALGTKIPKVHAGFQRAYRSLRVQVIDAIETMMKDVKIPNPRLITCGHSLGGALATLCIYDMRHYLQLPRDRVSCYTYGSPKVGNRPFARRYCVAVPHSFRVVNRFDGITNIPKGGLQHFEHVPRGVLIDEVGNFIFDPLFTDLEFFHGSQALPHLMGSYKDHMQKFLNQAENNLAELWIDFDAYESNKKETVLKEIHEMHETLRDDMEDVVEAGDEPKQRASVVPGDVPPPTLRQNAIDKTLFEQIQLDPSVSLRVTGRGRAASQLTPRQSLQT